MDDEVKKLLTKLDLQHLEDTFEQNKISNAVLPKLSENLITQLIPTIGDRAIFLSHWQKNFLNEPKNTDTIDDVCVNDILNKTEHGRRVLSSYKTTGKLNAKQRKTISSTIAQHFEDNQIHLDNKLAAQVGDQIISIFPTEVLTTYYVPPVSKHDSNTNKSKPSKGKLVNSYRNKKCSNTQLEKKISKEKSVEKNLQDTDETAAVDIISEKVKASIEWLKTNQVPWDSVLDHWKLTSTLRLSQIKSTSDVNLTNVFNEWHLYKHPAGAQLINIDFDQLQLTEVKLDQIVLAEFFEVLKECSSVSDRDETGNKCAEKLLEVNATYDSKVIYNIYLMAHFFPPKSTKKIAGHYFKPSIALSKESIIKIAPIPGDIHKICQDTKKEAMELKLKVQPYLIIVGSAEQIKEVYVVIDDVLYSVPGVFEGLDLCFKCFHVFQLEYPLASQHLWLLIQRGIYDFETPFDTTMPYLEHAIQQLKNKNIQRKKNHLENNDIADAEELAENNHSDNRVDV